MKRKHNRDHSPEKKSKRSNSPIASREELQKKKIQLIIYAGNLPNHFDEKQTLQWFAQHGNVIECKMINKPGALTKSALVKFESLTDAENAIERLKNLPINNNMKINVKWLDTEEQRLGIGEKDDHKLFVGSLPRQATDKTLYQVFSIFGKLQRVRLQENQYWAFIDYQRKQSALLAIKYLNGQTYLHGSRIPIQVRFKEKKYNSVMSKKHAQHQEDVDPFAYSISNTYHVITDPVTNLKYYYNYATEKSQYEEPPPGARIIQTINGENTTFFQQQPNTLNDMQNASKKFGPAGSNLFLFHLPNNLKDSQLYNLFKKFGNILSTRVMTQKNGKSKGIGFVSFDNPKSAADAIQEMNGHQIRGKRLKVELNKKDQKSMNVSSTSLQQIAYDYI